VQVGSDPTTAPRYYDVYNTHGDVVALVDSNGNAVSSYSNDAFGAVLTDTDNFSNGWRNPYLYDGKDDVRYDAETGLNWMSVRAYDPSTGRFISPWSFQWTQPPRLSTGTGAPVCDACARDRRGCGDH